jgi:DNA-directed RNA polymerase specialized sigma24 family protein
VYADIWEDPDRLRNVADEKELVRTVYLYYMRTRLREVYRRLNRNLHLSQESLQMLAAPDLGVLETMAEEERRQTVRQMLGKLQARERRAIELWMGQTAGTGAQSDRTVDGRYVYAGDCQ